MPEFRTEVAGLQAELCESIRRRPNDVTRTVQEIDKIRVVVYTVKDKVVLFSTLSVGHKVSGAAAASVAKGGRYPRGKLSDVNPVAPVQGCIVDCLRANYLPYGRVLRLQ
jgi:hypothetical protein